MIGISGCYPVSLYVVKLLDVYFQEQLTTDLVRIIFMVFDITENECSMFGTIFIG